MRLALLERLESFQNAITDNGRRICAMTTGAGEPTSGAPGTSGISDTTETSVGRHFNSGATATTVLLFAGIFGYALVEPAGFDRLMEKDSVEGRTGAIEHLTVAVLIPAVIAAAYALIRFRRNIPHKLIGLWIAGWCLACVYFAGEEASWGQWYFGWGTPEALAALNDQGETNFHNMSSWLDQKPRALVELFIVVGGLVLPIIRRMRPGRPVILKRAGLARLEDWVCAPIGLAAAAAVFAFCKVAGFFPGETARDLGGSELREFVIAWFLAWYLVWYAMRLRGGGPSEKRL